MSKNQKAISDALVFNSEFEAIRALGEAGKRLKYIAAKVWRQYLNSYKPEQYVRTNKSTKGIKLGQVQKLGANTYGVSVTFENDLMYHDSVIGKNQPKGHSIMLISEGWKVRSGKHAGIYRFGYYEGFDYLQKVREEFEKDRDRRINLVISWSGKKTK